MTLAERLPISNDARAAQFGSSGPGFAPQKISRRNAWYTSPPAGSITLIWRNKGIGWNVAGGEISVQSACALKTGDAVKMAFLHAEEIDKGVVLGGVKLNERLRFSRNSSRNVAAVGEEPSAKLTPSAPVGGKLS